MSTAAEVTPSQPTAGVVPTTPSSASSSVSNPQTHQQQSQQNQGLSRSPLPSPYSTQHQRPGSPQSQHQLHQRQQHHHHTSPLPPPPPVSLPSKSHLQQYSSKSSPTTPGEHTGLPNFFSHSHTPRTVPGMLHVGDRNATVPRGLPPMASVLSAASPRSMAMALSESQAALDVLAGDQTAPRKRSKVSRACDECRRKKIRCDATSESGMEQCSSCRRVGTKCSFSRVPMKRGPSKGYIKELAERLNTLENSISTGDLHHPYGVEGDLSPGPSESTSPPPLGGIKGVRKRTLSSSSEYTGGFHLQPLSQTSAVGRPQENRLPPIDSFHSAHQRSQALQHDPSRQLVHVGSRQPSHLPNSGTSHYRYSSISPDRRQQNWKSYTESDPTRRASIGSFVRQPGSPLKEKPAAFEWHEQAIDQYYALIHPTLPLLPHSKSRLQQLLDSAPVLIRDAFLEAVYAAIHSSPSFSQRPSLPPSRPRRAAELCLAAQYDSSVSSRSAKLILLQTMILLALEADSHGPRASGPSRATWVGSAVGLSHSMKLHYFDSGAEESAGGDSDTDEKLGRRAYWVLVVLDRWQAISTNSPLLIPDGTVVLMPEDQQLLGVAPFHLVRLSCILGHVSEALATTDPTVSVVSTTSLISRLLRGELERFRESAEPVWGPLILLHVAYYHVKLLTLRYNPSSEPRQLLEPTLKIATMLDHSSMPATPLNHHFTALVVETLVFLSEEGEGDVKDEAWKGLETIEEAMKKRGGSGVWEEKVEELVRRRLEERGRARGLERLAERVPAAADTGSRERRDMLDGWRLRREGYLGCIL